MAGARDYQRLIHLPDVVLAMISEHLSWHSALCFAAAITAPSASWSKTKWKCEPSVTSKAIISAWMQEHHDPEDDAHPWEQIDVGVLMGREKASTLTDGELGGILTCINAKSVVKRLSLTFCTNIDGSGLEPLRGSSILEQVDLCMVEKQSDPNFVRPKPMLSKDLVIPILDSIVDAEGSSLKQIQLPSAWKISEFRALLLTLCKEIIRLRKKDRN